MSFHVQDMCIHEPNMAKQFRESLLADLVHTVFIYAFFYLMQVPRSSLKVFITMFCFVFVWLLW